MKNERKWFDVDNIIDNKKRRKKIDAVNSFTEKLAVIRRFVVAEAAVQKVHLTDDEITGYAHSIYRQMSSVYA
jgi:hypothetical protein